MGESNGALPVEEGAMYVVMTKDASGYWSDVATVAVPKRTKRDTVIRRALEQVGMTRGRPAEMTVRVVPLEHAQEIPVSWEQPPPQLVIGGAS